MKYTTIYDLSTEKIHFFSSFLPPVYFLLIAGIFILIKYIKKDHTDPQKIRGIIIGVGLVSMSLNFLNIFLIRQFEDRDFAKHIMESGKFSVVEGKPQNYHPMPKVGHDTERFDIQRTHFGYSDYVLNAPGYHNAASLGGIITPENYYRLTYYEVRDIDSNRIIKIEIAN